ncbi:hypothetical protein [Legionella sp. km772]|uniref:hypothetical protein n=1 Tax=Legionella sp. km772 TaxID=2498111 RepID=UPI0013153471|nr:hypothetical protein [Legionella sp. km772]
MKKNNQSGKAYKELGDLGLGKLKPTDVVNKANNKEKKTYEKRPEQNPGKAL